MLGLSRTMGRHAPHLIPIPYDAQADVRGLRTDMQAEFKLRRQAMAAGFARADERMDAGFARVDEELKAAQKERTATRVQIANLRYWIVAGATALGITNLPGLLRNLPWF